MKRILILLLVLIFISGCNKTSNTGIANPASVFCEEFGTLEIRSDINGSQTGYCVFSDGSECEEWAFYRGECSRK